MISLKSIVFFTLASVASAANFDVVVGGPGVLKYTPAFVNAQVGDTITFNFKQKNHTATQSTLASPCTAAPNGFDSGFIAVPDSNTNGPFPQAKFTVRTLDPVWVYCKQGNHCQQGMVFAVNPGDKLAQFQAAATGGSSATATASSTGASASPSSSISKDHRVIVGGPGKLYYQPANITAQPGDTVTFEFRQKNHTVTQSAFNTPCRSLASTSTTGQVGFDSGFMAVADGATTFPTYVIQVNDTTPIWAYCRQSTHCGQGMVFSVNAVESGSNTFDAFKAKAMQQNGTSTSTSSGSNPSATSGASGSRALVSGGGILACLAIVTSQML